MSKGAKLTARGLYRRSLATLEPSCALHQSLIGARREMPIDDQDNSRSLLDKRFNKGPNRRPVLATAGRGHVQNQTHAGAWSSRPRLPFSSRQRDQFWALAPELDFALEAREFIEFSKLRILRPNREFESHPLRSIPWFPKYCWLFWSFPALFPTPLALLWFPVTQVGSPTAGKPLRHGILHHHRELASAAILEARASQPLSFAIGRTPPSSVNLDALLGASVQLRCQLLRDVVRAS